MSDEVLDIAPVKGLRGRIRNLAGEHPEIGSTPDIIIRGSIAAFSVHVGFLLFALYLGAYPLARLNIVSLILYVACIYLLRLGHVRVATMLWAMEFCAHAMLATQTFGWNAGFHYYLIIFVPFMFVQEQTSLLFRYGFVSLILGVYIGIYYAPEVPGLRLDLPASMPDLMQVANLVGLFVSLSYLSYLHRIKITRAQDKLAELAHFDSLTGLVNRRYATELISQQLKQGRRSQRATSIAVIDIDHFKQINDRHGHDFGDEVLRKVSDLLVASVREQDIVARWGGEEFLLVLPATDLTGAHIIAESVRHQVNISAVTCDGKQIGVTASIGIAEIAPGESFRDSFVRADKSLYLAKQSGRNRVLGQLSPA